MQKFLKLAFAMVMITLTMRNRFLKWWRIYFLLFITITISPISSLSWLMYNCSFLTMPLLKDRYRLFSLSISGRYILFLFYISSSSVHDRPMFKKNRKCPFLSLICKCLDRHICGARSWAKQSVSIFIDLIRSSV